MVTEKCLRQEAVSKDVALIIKAQICYAACPVTLKMVPIVTAKAS